MVQAGKRKKSQEELAVNKDVVEIFTDKVEAQNYIISLTEVSDDPQTLFEILPLYSQTDTEKIPINSLVRIRHTTT